MGSLAGTVAGLLQEKITLQAVKPGEILRDSAKEGYGEGIST
jgi:cytidylate kinase